MWDVFVSRDAASCAWNDKRSPLPHTLMAPITRDAGTSAVRLPSGYRFAASEVYIRRDPITGDVILSLRPYDPLSPFGPHPPLDDVDAYRVPGCASDSFAG